MNIRKITYLNCWERYENINDHCSYIYRDMGLNPAHPPSIWEIKQILLILIQNPKFYPSKMTWSCDKYKVLYSTFKYLPSCCSTVAMMVAVAASCSPCWATKIESSLTSTWLSALCKITEKSYIKNYRKLVTNWPKEYCYITPTSEDTAGTFCKSYPLAKHS